MMNQTLLRTAEHVSEGHPDKFCDQVADRILDEVLSLAHELGGIKAVRRTRTAIECLVKDNLLVVSGEIKIPDDIAVMRAELRIAALAREVWKKVGYGDDPEKLTVINHLRPQSPDIGEGDSRAKHGVNEGSAGDQGIMVGYATDETPALMPTEWMIAHDLCWELRQLRLDKKLEWLRSDCKSQVTLAPNGQVSSVVIAAQHAEEVDNVEIQREILDRVVIPILDKYNCTVANSQEQVKINGTGRFVIGGPAGDAGVVGRKIVVDAYGPRVSVGGGAYSGKDPTKVDRSAAYMARHIAKTIVANKIGKARTCEVVLAYGIGQFEPEMVTAITDIGNDLSDWVRANFKLTPDDIRQHLRLWAPNGWSYLDTAAYGHYGREEFPWERVS